MAITNCEESLFPRTEKQKVELVTNLFEKINKLFSEAEV